MFSLEFSEDKYLSLKRFEPVVSSVSDQDVIKAPARHLMIDRIFKLTPIHVSVIYQISQNLLNFSSI